MRTELVKPCGWLCVCDSQLALQGHGGVDAFSQGGATLVQGRGQLGADQTPTGVTLRRTAFPLLGGRHVRLVHTIELN